MVWKPVCLGVREPREEGGGAGEGGVEAGGKDGGGGQGPQAAGGRLYHSQVNYLVRLSRTTDHKIIH